MKTKIATMTAVLALAGCSGGGSGAADGSAGTALTSSGSVTAVPVASLLEAREDASCALVGTGSVLVLGGRTASAQATDTAEMIEATGAIHPVLARMTTPRAGASAVTLDEDRVLVIGGHDASGAGLASTEVYSAALHAFADGPTLAAAHDGAATAEIGTLVYVLGGKNETSVEEIEAATLGSRKLGGHFERPHAGAQAASSGRTVVVGGGRDTDSPEAYDVGAEKTVYLGATDQVRGQTLCVLGGSVHLIGGSGEAAVLTPFTKVLADELRPATPLGSPRVHGTGVPFMGGVLVMGGDDRKQALGSTDLLLPNETCRRGPALGTPREGMGAVALADGRIVVVGGTLPNGVASAACDMIVPPGGVLPASNVGFDAAASEDQQLAATIQELNDTRAALRAADDQIVNLNATIASVTAQRDAAKAQVVSYQAQLTTTQQALSSAQSQTAAAQSQIAALTARAQQLQAAITAANAQVSSLTAQVSSLQSALAQAQVTEASERAQIQSLQAQLAAAKAAPASTGGIAITPVALTPQTPPRAPVVPAP